MAELALNLKVTKGKINNMQNWLEIGKIVRPHGVKGAVKVLSYLDGVNFSIFNKIYLGSEKQVAKIVKCLPLNGDAFSLALEGTTSVEQAEKLREKHLFIDRDEYPQFRNKVYLSDLIGTNILDENGNTLGILLDVNEYGASTILEIKCGFLTYSLPFVNEYIHYDENKKALVTTKQIFEDMRV